MSGIKWFVPSFFLLCFFHLAGVFAAVSAEMPANFPQINLPSKLRGDAAIAALGNKIPALAAFYRTTEAELKNRLRRDKMLWVDELGRLFYVCQFEFPPPDDNEEVVAETSPIDTGAVDRTQTFLLHSRPGATKIIYLDFDGHDASATSWGADAIGLPFDLDGNISSFSSTERDRIQYIWQRVAEDYAIYDIDVTTEDPGVEALRKSNTSDAAYGIRVVIGGGSTDWFVSSGGVAYVGSFDWNSDTPCWVFPKSLSSTEKNIAEAISHEVGHTLGLSHDGKTDGTEYYAGQGNWAPIMGVGYSEPITQWSKGEYALANNTQDDLTVMLTHGAAYRLDDFGNSTANARMLPGVSFTTNGVIERTTDADFFKFQTGAGRAILTITPAPRGPNLHILLSLYNSSGTLLVSANAADTSAGVLPVTISTNLPTGIYYFSVDGIGYANPASDGYSEYASLGQYIVSGTLIPDTAWLPTLAGDFSWTNTANWLSNNVPDSADVTARLNNNLAGDQIITLDKPITIGSLILGDTDSTHSFTVQNGAGGSLALTATSGAASIVKKVGVNDFIAADLILQSDLVISNSSLGYLIFSGSTTGSRSVTKDGGGNVLFDAAQNFSGVTIIRNGSLQLSAAAALPNTPEIRILAGASFDVSAALPDWTLRANQILSGNGNVFGNIVATNGAKISPGDASAGTLSLSNNLILNDGVQLNFDLADSDGIGVGTNDLLVVGGDLSLNGTVTLNFNFLNFAPLSPGNYTLIRYGGILSGSAANFSVANLSTRFSFLVDTSVAGEVRVQVSGTPDSLVWQGDAVSNRWELSSTNWQFAGSPAPFFQLDNVTFDDAGSESPAINLLTSVRPASVLISGAKNYTFSGAGKISGATGLAKQGSGILTLNTTNDFTGAIVISGGTLKTGNGSALGSSTTGTTISSGARLDLNAQNLGAEPIVGAGSGISSAGAIINSSATAQTNALRFVTLSADTTFGGTGRWDVRANPTASFSGNNFALAKTGLNDVWLANLGATGLGDIIVNQGLFGVEGTTTLGNATNTLTAAAGAKIGIANTDVNVLNKKWMLNGAILQSLSGNNSIAGTMTLSGSNQMSSTAILEVQSQIGGTGSLTKTGSGVLALAAINSFSGNVLVSAGTLRPGNAAALGDTNGTTTIASGARLDVNGFNLGAEPVNAQGTGLGNAGAIINSGGSQNNALRFVTLSGNTTFGGINRWDIRANPTGSLVGNNFTLTKTGINTIYLVDLGNTGLGAISVNEGLFGVQGTSTLGTSASTLSIAANATFGIFATGTNTLAKIVTMSSARISNGSGSNTLIGATSLSGTNAFDISSGTTLVMGGNISGSGSLEKITTGTLILTGTNLYTGPTTISAGPLQVGNGGPGGTLGTGAITNKATLIFKRTNDFSVPNFITGIGSLNQNGSGAVILSGNNSYTGHTIISSGVVAVLTDAALGASVLNFSGNNGGFRSANVSARTLNNEIILGGLTATFGSAGTGDLIFNGAGVNNGTVAKTIIVSNATTTINNAIANRGAILKDGPGTLVLGGNNSHTDATTVLAGALRIDSEARLGLNPDAFDPAHLTLNGGALQPSASFSIADVNRGLTLGANGGTFNINSGLVLTLSQPITGSGALIKTGAGTLWTTISNNFSGATFISAGTLALSGAGALVATPTIDVGSPAILDVSGIFGFVLGSSQTLSGNGTIKGTAQIDGAVSPSGAAGRLTFQNDLLLRGSALINVNKNGSALTNDSLAVSNSLSLGGSLVVTTSGDALADGDQFRLFDAASFSDVFSNLSLPALSSNLFWDASNLATDGTLRVASIAPPEIFPPTLSGTNLLISVNGQSGLSYILQASTNLAPPIAWFDLATNSGAGAVLTFSIPVDASEAQSFFRVVVRQP